MESEQFAGLRVLVVDDDRDAAMSLAGLLELHGCETAFAFEAATACRVAQAFRPRIVFLDLDMPGANGCEALRKLRELDSDSADVLFVCLTGTPDPKARERCLAAGFHHFVIKPMHGEQLLELLREGGRPTPGRSA